MGCNLPEMGIFKLTFMITELKNIFGPKYSAININGETTEFMNIPAKPMKFCEAVNHSFNIPVRLINENLGCPGARRGAGFDNNDRITGILHTVAKSKIMPSIPPYSLLSVCGNVFANCYKNQTVSISFGCPESRKYGGIEQDEVVIGFPFKTAKFIIDVI